MQAERQETTFRFRFFSLPLAHPELRPGTLRIVPPPSRLSVVARHVGFRVPTHGGRALRKSGAAPAGNGRMPCGVPPHLGL